MATTQARRRRALSRRAATAATGYLRKHAFVPRYGVEQALSLVTDDGVGLSAARLAGPADAVCQARIERKRLGGGMRQVGILAAAGLLALDRVERLADDHARARRLALAAAERWPASVDVALVQTNIVRIEVADPAALLAHLAAEGVLAVPGSATTVRLVTHPDVDDADVERTVAALGSAP